MLRTIAAMFILIAALLPYRVSANTDQNVSIFAADYRNNSWIVAVQDNKGFYNAGALTMDGMKEDMISFGVITGTLHLDNSTITLYSAEYSQDLTFTFRAFEDDNTVSIDNAQYNGSFYTGTINGTAHQFFSEITNDSAYMLRNADPNGKNGYIVQHGTLIITAAYATDNGAMLFIPIASN